jgi:hypothetical protein
MILMSVRLFACKPAYPISHSPYSTGVLFGLSQIPGIEVVKKGAIFPQYYPLFDNSIEGSFASVQIVLPVRKVS